MPAASLEERQEFTPDGQELPPWLGYEEAETGAQPVVFQAEAKVTTTIDGVVITTGTVVQLPQTYYGPSIPLGEGWAYGGTSSPPPGATGTSPDADPTVSTDASSSQATATPNKDSTAAAPTTSLSNAATTTGTSPLPPIPAPSASPLSSAVLTSSSSPISPSSISTLSTASQPSTDPSASTIPNNFDVHTDRRTTLAVLIPSLIGSLLVAVLILLVVICYKRRSDYRRAGTTAPSDADPSSIRGPSRLIATRAASNNYSKVPTADPGGDASIGPADVAATSAPGIDKKPYGNSGLYDPSGPAPASGDITDHPYTSHPHSRSNILSRISLGLGLGAPPIARSISNGTAEKALPGGRMPSWAAMADIGTAVRRHVSSSTFGRVISRASGYGPAGGLDGVGEVDVGEKQGLHASSSGAVAGTGGVPGGYTDKKHSEGIETLNTGIKTGQPTPGVHQPSDSLNTTIPPSHSQSNSRSMGSEELFFAPPPSASTYLYGLFRSRSSRQTSHSGGTGSGAGTHTSHSGSAVGSGEGSDESRGTVITHGTGPSSWRDRVRAFAGDDFGVRMRTRAIEATAGEGEREGEEDTRMASNAALPLGANDHLPAYSYANVLSMEGHHEAGIADGRHTAQAASDDYNDSTLRARRHHDPPPAMDTPAQQGRYISVGIPETPASRVGSVPSFHSSNILDDTSPTRLEGDFTTGQGQGKRDPSERYGRDGRSRFPSTGGDRLDFPLPPVAPWGQAAGAESRLGKGRGDEADSVIAQSDYHSAHSQLSSRPPSSRQSTQLIRKSTPPKPEETKQDTSSPLGTIRRALGLSGLFRSRLSSRPTSGPVPLLDTAEGSAAVADLSTQRSAALGTSERTRSFESGSRLSHGDTLAMGSVEGPLTSRALRARQALPLDMGQTGGDGRTYGPSQARQAEAVEIGRALGVLGVRGGLGGSEEWDEFGQLRDRRRPTNPIPPLARHSHIGSIHISDSSPSRYSRATRGAGGTSSSGAVQSHEGDSASVAGSGTGSGSRSGGASAGHGSGNDSIGSGVSKVSAGVPDRALRGRRSAATLVRSSSLKSTATNTGTTQLSSAASTPMQLLPNNGQMPRSVPPYPARPPRLQPLSTSAPSTDESDR